MLLCYFITGDKLPQTILLLSKSAFWPSVGNA
jgi:hypothetical protein